MKYVRYTLLGIFFCVTYLFASTPQISQAASLYIDPSSSELNRGDSVIMAVRLDTDETAGECINAVDAVIKYSASVDPVDVSIGSSILRLWVEEPVIDKTARTISFSGGIPNGYCGRVAGDPRLTNVLVEIIFQSPGFVIGVSEEDRSLATIAFSEISTAYINDGLGTMAPLSLYDAQIKLTEKAGNGLQNDWKELIEVDTIPPEPFTIGLVQRDLEFNGKHFIVFSTTDKQTGIDQYQVMEEPISQHGAFQWGRADAPWITARSPYVLKDQSLNSTIRVRAFDKAGNVYIATYVPEESKRTMSQAQKMTYFVIGFSVLVVLMVVLTTAKFVLRWRKRVNKKASKISEQAHNDSDSEEEVIIDSNDEK
jgi:hypothetical protein